MLNLHLIAHLWDPGHSLNKQDVFIDSNLCYKEKLHYKKNIAFLVHLLFTKHYFKTFKFVFIYFILQVDIFSRKRGSSVSPSLKFHPNAYWASPVEFGAVVLEKNPNVCKFYRRANEQTPDITHQSSNELT